jgi:polygalacturonase
MESRRDFLKLVASCGAAIIAFGTTRGAHLPEPGPLPDPETSGDPWDEVPRILERIKPPAFPSREFNVENYGAVGDAKTDCTEAFRKAITACNAASGGRVVVPKGEFLTGAIHLKSNFNLRVNSGATIRFTRDTKQYPLVFTRFEGMELMNYSPFLYALEQENIAISGQGIIDGSADAEHWWAWKSRTRPSKDLTATPNDRDVLIKMAETGVPVSKRIFGEGHYLRPQFIQPYRCKNVLIEGVTLLNSPMWQVHPVLCANVTVRKLKINADGPNTDGCDPESCTDVLIEDCVFNTGDDCIAIKSGRNADGRRVNVPSQNIIIRDCHMKNGHGGVTVGSEISGGVHGVFAEHCQMDSPKLDIAIRLKNNAMRGGLLENIYVRDISVGQVGNAAVSIDFYYEEGKVGSFKPVVRNVTIEKLRTQKTQYALYLRGFENAPIEKVAFIDCDFSGVAKPNVVENVRDISVRNVRINGTTLERLG